MGLGWGTDDGWGLCGEWRGESGCAADVTLPARKLEFRVSNNTQYHCYR